VTATGDRDLDGRVILVTGASGGIGAKTARLLAERGAAVVAHYGQNRVGAEAAFAGISEAGVLLVQADLASPGAGRRLFADALAWRGAVDVAVVNAATLLETPPELGDDLWDSRWEEPFRVNGLEPANLLREVARHAVTRGSGTIIVISSWAAERGSAIPLLPAYAASKAALRNLAQTFAFNYARQGLRCYVVAPGIVDTPMSTVAAVARGGVEKVNRALAMGEMVPAEEVAEIVAFLATGRCAHLSGATLDVNGATYIR
jgi:NAD(P)-dependent dehydrogenase (short-subunit alcohol dehydrogenase family)